MTVRFSSRFSTLKTFKLPHDVATTYHLYVYTLVEKIKGDEKWIYQPKLQSPS